MRLQDTDYTTVEYNVLGTKCDQAIKDCVDGKHKLIFIHGKSHWDESESTVRWCKNCGAIVIDRDYDNRTIPGGVMKMEFPEITRWTNTKK